MKYLAKREAPLVQHFDLLATAPGGIARLRELILTLALQGKLVPQNANDEPAIDLLKSSRAEKLRLVAAGEIQRDRAVSGLGNKPMPFDLPIGWEWIQLGALLPFRIGRTPPSKDPQYWGSSGHAWVSIGDMTHFGEIHETSRKITGKGAAVFGHPPLPVGTLIMSFKLTIGKIAVLRVPAYHNEAIMSFHPLSGLNTDFLKYILPIVANSGSSKNALMGQTLNTDSLSNLLIALPPLAEQTRIVTRVEELMRLCDALEAKGKLEAAQHSQLVTTLLGTLTDSESPEALADRWQRIAAHFDILLDRPEAVDALEQTILQLAVRGLLASKLDELANQQEAPQCEPSWRERRLGDIAELINGDRGSNYPNKAEYVQKGVPFINTGHIEPDGSISHERMNFLSTAKFNSLRGGKVRKGDLVYCLRGATLGKTAIVSYEEGAIASSLVIVRPSPELNAKYAYLYLTSPLGRSFIWQHENGSAQPNLAAASLKKYRIALPPLAVQTRIVARVEELRRLCADLRHRLVAAQATQTQLSEALVAQPTP